MTKLALVTGGAGFIGSHLTEALLAQGPVRVLDNLDTGSVANLPAQVEFVQADIRDLEAVEKACAGVQTVYHLAALASVQASVEDPQTSHAICATGTVNVLRAAQRAGAQRVVYAGSASAYGIPDHDVQAETDPSRALSPYAAAKLAGEYYCQAFAECYGLETVCLRFFNVFGPRQRPDSPYSGVIARFVSTMTAGRAPTIFGDGQQSRDFVYVGNVVQALQKAGAVEGIAGRVYNVGTGERTSLLTLLASLNQLLGTTHAPQHGEARAGDIRHSCANIARIRQELGYEPTITFLEGMKRTITWYHSQK